MFFKTFSERVFIVIDSCCWTLQNEIVGYSNGFIDQRNEPSKYFCIFHLQSTILNIHCGRPWPAAYINFNQNIHQIQVLTKPLCHAQAIFHLLPNNKWGTKYRGLTYSAK